VPAESSSDRTIFEYASSTARSGIVRPILAMRRSAISSSDGRNSTARFSLPARLERTHHRGLRVQQLVGAKPCTASDCVW
jgi:hypothetical protein